MPMDLAVVPVAGQGTRLLPLTKSQPKEMLPVGGRPVVQYVVEELTRCGVRRQLGLGHAVLCARSLVGRQPFVVALGDSIIGVHAQSCIVRELVEQFETS